MTDNMIVDELIAFGEATKAQLIATNSCLLCMADEIITAELVGQSTVFSSVAATVQCV